MDIRYNEIVFLGKDDKYYIVELKKFVNLFKKCVFSKKLDNDQIKSINEYVLKNAEEINKEEYENRIEMREKADRAMQVDYSNFA